MRESRLRVCGTLALLLLLGIVAGVAGQAEQQNGAGAVLRSITTETDSAAPSMANGARNAVTLVGAGQAGPDLQNATGARLYLGHPNPLPVDAPRLDTGRGALACVLKVDAQCKIHWAGWRSLLAKVAVTFLFAFMVRVSGFSVEVMLPGLADKAVVGVRDNRLTGPSLADRMEPDRANASPPGPGGDPPGPP